MYPVQIETANLPQVRRSFEPFASTEPRFGFDAYCTMQLLLVHEPVASGAVLWFVDYAEGTVEANPVKPFSLLPNCQSWAASGALTVDASLLFTDQNHRTWNSPVKPTWHALWLDVARHNFRANWRSLAEMVLAAAPEVGPIVTSRRALPSYSLQLPIAVPGQPIDIARPYSELLKNSKLIGPWSWKKLARLLGTSHTQLRRIGYEGAVPGDDLAPRIDELYRFAQRLVRLTSGDPIVTKRLLTTPRERDRQSANNFLERHDYRNAFRAVMEAASPPLKVADVATSPRRWYDEPSRDLYDDEVATEE